MTTVGTIVRQRLVTRLGWLLVGLPFFLGLIAGLVEGSALGILVGLPGSAVVGFFAYGAWHARLLVQPDRVRKRYMRGWQPALRFDDLTDVSLTRSKKGNILILGFSSAMVGLDQVQWPLRRVCRVLAPHLLARSGRIEIVDRVGALDRALSS